MECTSISPRKFAPQPYDTTAETSRGHGVQDKQPVKRSKFAPQPNETTIRSSRARSSSDSQLAASEGASAGDEKPEKSSGTDLKPRRKFAPQLIETAKRTRKPSEGMPTLLQFDRTEDQEIGIHGVATVPSISKALHFELEPRPPQNTLIPDEDHVLAIDEAREARRLGIPLPKRQDSKTASRSHSFRVPELDPIESSESGESTPPSLSTSPSTLSDQSYLYKHATRMRESVDERYSGYLLNIAARTAEKQLREQALAAFPNDDQHEPVDHYVGRDSEITTTGRSSPAAQHRKNPSSSAIGLELRTMQAHQERLAKDRRQQSNTNDLLARNQQAAAKGPWVDPAAVYFGILKDKEMESMRNSARPPMLGGDLEFPRCESPDPAHFDVTQRPGAFKEAMCYLTEQAQECTGETLWHGESKSTASDNIRSPGASGPSSPGSAGLWHGCCTAPSKAKVRTGLLTPRPEKISPVDTPVPSPAEPALSAPAPNARADLGGIEERLAIEAAIDEEFGDEFVTQVYNYLSLGYPSIGRDFDEELCKVSHIPIAELRQDDRLASGRGYIRLGADANAATREAGIAEEHCVRWRALRAYIREWARQRPEMISSEYALGGFGVLARRGSWAW